MRFFLSSSLTKKVPGTVHLGIVRKYLVTVKFCVKKYVEVRVGENPLDF